MYFNSFGVMRKKKVRQLIRKFTCHSSGNLSNLLWIKQQCKCPAKHFFGMLVTEAGVTPSHISAPKNSPRIISFQVTGCSLPEPFRASRQWRRGCPWAKPLRGLIKNSTECCIKLLSLQTVLSSLFIGTGGASGMCHEMGFFPSNAIKCSIFFWTCLNRLKLSGVNFGFPTNSYSYNQPTSTLLQKITSKEVYAVCFCSEVNLKFHALYFFDASLRIWFYQMLCLADVCPAPDWGNPRPPDKCKMETVFWSRSS